ncbi:M20/M25/M40 family metallo-hydrolase [Nakamurella lactea]|uniref:M20/M25/M40 family metallo-hydrolase n=1 Tax=Nakamurella lactea TaxID=459515 RepID=UPI0006861BD3|nr:M20/M25/M40 family metallo-hydrolase [Nakamurella lactea]
MTSERQAVADGFDAWVTTLSQWVAIPSVSADPDRLPEVGASAEFLAQALRRTGFPQVEVLDSGPYQPAVYAHWPSGDANAVRVVVYGHHDVQPADGEDRWTHPPFEPMVIDEVLYGRGASDDKGNIGLHLLGLTAHLAATGRSAPAVDLTLLVEGEEESGSPHIADLLADLDGRLDADLIVVSDTGIFDAQTPSLCVGMRGMVSGELHVHGPEVDLHSGIFGGAVPNPITELARLLAGMHDEHGHITIPGFYQGVIEPTEADRTTTAALPFDETAWLAGPAHSRATWGEAGYSTLERIGIRPTAEINGIYGGYTGPGGKTIIPTDAYAKLSFRLVGRQDPAAIRAAITGYFADQVRAGLMAELTWEGDGVSPLFTDPQHPATAATQRALGGAFDTDTVLLTREGGSGPEADLVAAIGAPMVFLGVMTDDDQVHAPNERAPLALLRKGCEAVALLWRELAELGRTGLGASRGN